MIVTWSGLISPDSAEHNRQHGNIYILFIYVVDKRRKKVERKQGEKVTQSFSPAHINPTAISESLTLPRRCLNARQFSGRGLHILGVNGWVSWPFLEFDSTL